MKCCKERHPLLPESFIIFYRYIRMSRRASDSIYKILTVHIMSFDPKTTLTYVAKYQTLGTLSVPEMRYCAIRRDIHCY